MNESQQLTNPISVRKQIAREARERIKKLGLTFSIQWDADVDAFILSAIERATEEGDAICDSESPSPVSNAVQAPRLSETGSLPKGQEWTWYPVTGGVWIKQGKKVIARFGERDWSSVKQAVTTLFNAHNSALAAERQRTDHWARVAEMFRVQLLSAQAAIEKVRALFKNQTSTNKRTINPIWSVLTHVDLSLLHQHDAEVRNNSLKELADILDNNETYSDDEIGVSVIRTDALKKFMTDAKVRKPLVDALKKIRKMLGNETSGII